MNKNDLAGIPAPPDGFTEAVSEQSMPKPPEGFTEAVGSDTYEEAPKPYQAPPGNTKGIGGAFMGGVQQVGRSIGAFADVLQGDTQEIIADAAKPALRTGAQNRFMAALEANKDRYGDESVWQAVKNVAGAIGDEPMGALHETAAQLPNSAAVMGSAAAGAALGSAIPGVGTAVGAVVGGIAGYFLGNTAIETGGIAQEMGREGEVDTGKALTQGAIKGGVITAIDTGTIFLNKFMFGAPGKAAAEATTKIFAKYGVDAADSAAVRAAYAANPMLPKIVKEGAMAAAVGAMPKGMKRAALVTAGLGLESLSEGAGEYLGSAAAGLDASFTEAVMESLMSLPQSAIETGYTETFARRSQQKQLDRASGALEGYTEFTGPMPEAPFVPSDVPTTEGYDVQEMAPEEIGIETMPEPPAAAPFPAAEGIQVEEVMPRTPLQELADRFRRDREFRNRAEPQIMGAAEQIDITELPTGFGGAAGTVFDALAKKEQESKAAAEAEVAKRNVEKAKTQTDEQKAAEYQGLREDIDRRRAEAQAAFTSAPPAGKTRAQQVDEYIATTEQLDKEEKALKKLEQALPKPAEQKPAPKVEPLPLPKVQELEPGVIDEKRPDSGKPYKTYESADNIRNIVPKYANYEIVEKDGGFVLQDRGQLPDLTKEAQGVGVEEVTGGQPRNTAMEDALRGAGIETQAEKDIREQYPMPPRQAYPGRPEDVAVEPTPEGQLPPLPGRQAGFGDNVPELPTPPEQMGPQREVPGFLYPDEKNPLPGRNGPQEGAPTVSPVKEIQDRAARIAKNKEKVFAQLKDEGLVPGTAPAEKRAKEVRALMGLDDTYDDIQGPPAGSAMGPPEGGAMGPPAPAGEAPSPKPPEQAAKPPEQAGARDDLWKELEGEGQATGFTPTHQLPDGTPVTKNPDEDNVYTDAEGQEYVEPNAKPYEAPAEEKAIKFTPYPVKTSEESFGIPEADLMGIMLKEEVDDGTTVDVPAGVLMRMSNGRISILNQLGRCVS